MEYCARNLGGRDFTDYRYQRSVLPDHGIIQQDGSALSETMSFNNNNNNNLI